MKKGLLFVGLILCLLLVVNVSAGIYFSQTGDIYNIGDMIEVEVSVDPVMEGHLLKTDLMCSGNKVIEFNNFPEDGKVLIKLPLTYYTLKDYSGSCYFSSEYSGEVKNSRNFEISKKLEVSLDTNSFFVNPGEEIVIKGSAKRLNGAAINGQVEVSIPLLSLAGSGVQAESENASLENSSSENLSIKEAVEQYKEQTASVDNGVYYGKVEDGVFSISINLSQNTPAGDYRIDVLVYEEYAGKRSSEGSASADMKIFQVPTAVDVALNEQNFNPGDLITLKPLLTDQSGTTMSSEISVIITDESKERVFEKIAKSEETVEFKVPTNLTSGYYEVNVYSRDLSSSKKFYLNEKAIASFELTNDTLRVTNIGNIRYKKDIQIEMNGKPFIKKMDLDLGESQTFKLTGNGQFDVKISDGETEITQSGISLTGYAVGVKDVKSSGLALKTPIVWIFFIVVLGAGVLFLFRNIFKKKSYAFPFADKFRKKGVVEIKPPEGGAKPNLGAKIPQASKGPVPAQSQAEQVLVLKGHRSRVAVIVIKIKNKIGKLEKQSLEKAIESVYKKRGAVYEQGDHIFVVFSPLMTRTLNNEAEAAKAAENIALILNEHNKKFKDKIHFGIGVNSGDVINKIENKKLKFTALGSVILAAKKLAGMSHGKVLVTKQAFEKCSSEVKAEKIKVNGAEAYELRRIVDSDKNQAFIKGFLQRMDENKR